MGIRGGHPNACMAPSQVQDNSPTDLIAQVWRLTLTRMLLLSLALHTAVVMIVQPRPYPAMPEVTVISARLIDAATARQHPETPPPLIAPETTPTAAATPPTGPEPAPVVEKMAPPPEPVATAKSEPVSPRSAPEVERKASPTPRSEPAASSTLPSMPVMIDANWYEARQLDVQPKAAAEIVPRYPPDAVTRGLQGSVKLRLRVDEFGLVREAEVEEGDPPGVFDESALAAFRNARFVAAVKDGRPVRALIYIRVKYELNDDY